MKVEATLLPGVMVVEGGAFDDDRGAFQRLFCEEELAEVLCGRRIVQINHSRTASVGAIRGMHYQRPPHAEMKLIRCLKGQVYDVAVDLRAGSATFLRWHGEILTPENRRMLVIPEGCAHGFQVLEPQSELLYLHTASYVPTAEDAVLYNDPQLGVAWPLPARALSARDSACPLLDDSFSGISS